MREKGRGFITINADENQEAKINTLLSWKMKYSKNKSTSFLTKTK